MAELASRQILPRLTTRYRPGLAAWGGWRTAVLCPSVPRRAMVRVSPPRLGGLTWRRPECAPQEEAGADCEEIACAR
jgi:hypothetical protein